MASPSALGLVAMIISSTVPALEALDQTLQMQLIGADASQRRERPAKHVIEAAVLASFFDGHDVVRFFHDADRLATAR